MENSILRIAIAVFTKKPEFSGQRVTMLFKSYIVVHFVW